MEENEIKPIRDNVLKNKKLAELVLKYCFEMSSKERGQFLSLIWESYNIGLKDGEKDEKQSLSDEDKLKALAIKWVKEDFRFLEFIKPDQIIRKWMRRLNITEEDLE